MSVYVDPVLEHGGSATFRWKRSCHLYADRLDELHALAAALGLRRAWFQNHDRLPHYDLVPSKRARAVALGAREHTREQMVQFLRGPGRPRGRGASVVVLKGSRPARESRPAWRYISSISRRNHPPPWTLGSGWRKRRTRRPPAG